MIIISNMLAGARTRIHAAFGESGPAQTAALAQSSGGTRGGIVVSDTPDLIWFVIV